MLTPKNIRVVFMGTGKFAAKSLRALIETGYELIGIYTRPLRRAGRGRKTIADNPVRAEAEKRNIPLFDPVDKLDTTENLAVLQKLNPDIVVVVSYGKILPPKVLSLPRHGCLNVHASLLPRWRGASPVQHAILFGDCRTGVTVMKMDENLDTGPILLQKEISLHPDIRAPELSEKLAALGAVALTETLPAYLSGKATPQPQPSQGATYCQTLSREDGHLDWSRSAREIYNRFRAFYPWPGVFSLHRRNDTVERIKFLELTPVDEKFPDLPAGTVVDLDSSNNSPRPAVTTAGGAVEIKKLQRAGKKPQTAREFLNGCKNFIGARLA